MFLEAVDVPIFHKAFDVEADLNPYPNPMD